MFVIPRGVLEARRIAAQEKTRFAMNGIEFKRMPDGKVQATATDGKRAIRFELDDSNERTEFPELGLEIGATPGFTVILSLDVIEKALKIMPRKASRPILTHLAIEEKLTDGRATIASTDLETHTKFGAVPVEGNFPPVDEVWPKGQPSFRTCFNPEYLLELAKTLVEGRGDSAWSDTRCCRLDFYGETGAIVVSAGAGIKAAGLLMPITHDAEGETVFTANANKVSKLEKEIGALKNTQDDMRRNMKDLKAALEAASRSREAYEQVADQAALENGKLTTELAEWKRRAEVAEAELAKIEADADARDMIHEVFAHEAPVGEARFERAEIPPPPPPVINRIGVEEQAKVAD